jgi:hypothetical protein
MSKQEKHAYLEAIQCRYSRKVWNLGSRLCLHRRPPA